ncbi:Histone H2A.V [Schistosoma haematobium]|uniref:Histone H2A.V n=1 Tax=Schistosoma haematobium TaxID=6185 RepID=A0A922ILL4_SCHHA|nr:Histone H2A.V [Schistosoma haematobium]KAH9581372.1 Histone H2A.V [Schistosoma haematobium]
MILFLLILLLSISSGLGGQEEMAEFARTLLHHHNYVRQTRNQCDYYWSTPSETKLGNLTWDDGLQVTAQQYAEQCENSPSRLNDRTTCRWKSVGQNIAQVHSVSYAINVWRDGSRFYSFKNDKCGENYDCSMYKQIVNINTTHIGCGVHMCNKNINKGKYIVVCNYAPAASKGRPYDDGTNTRCKQ